MAKLTKVGLEGFDAARLLQAAREGRLYVKESAPEESRGERRMRCQDEALAYVAAIDQYAVDEWRPYIKQLWKAIVNDMCFAPRLVMARKGELNRYFVTSIVMNLQYLGIYLPTEKVSVYQLHLTLEHTQQKNSILKNCDKYGVTPEQRRALSDIAKSVKQV
jgi:hypothetical protein